MRLSKRPQMPPQSVHVDCPYCGRRTGVPWKDKYYTCKQCQGSFPTALFRKAEVRFVKKLQAEWDAEQAPYLKAEEALRKAGFNLRVLFADYGNVLEVKLEKDGEVLLNDEYTGYPFSTYEEDQQAHGN